MMVQVARDVLLTLLADAEASLEANREALRAARAEVGRLTLEEMQLTAERNAMQSAMARRFGAESTPSAVEAPKADVAGHAEGDWIRSTRLDAVEAAVAKISHESGAAKAGDIQEFLIARGRHDGRDAIAAALSYLRARRGTVDTRGRGNWVSAVPGGAAPALVLDEEPRDNPANPELAGRRQGGAAGDADS